MSYLNRARDPRRRTTAIAGVILVHAVLGYALVTGLQFTGVIAKPEWKPIIEIEAKPTPTPTPQPSEEARPEATRKPDVVVPDTPIDLVRTTEVEVVAIERDAIVDPIPAPTPGFVDPPRPQPGFAPKRAAPRGDTSRWVTPDDYPSRELRNGIEGTTHVRVVVGTAGRAGASEVTRSSGNARLDAAACRNVMSRARFDPATDGNGQKVVGSYSSSVRWQIPD